ncbi:prostatic acid phosphatase-like [Arctopsyche grandis]|uniref:prostatic acid phosphatase-like n=1 Tax=Arctopsyche grandis TaxID=121162 RepID=UPI00406D7D43
MICCTVLVFLLLELTGVKTEFELVQVSLVTRHGQRTPEAPFPKDPWCSAELWPQGWMQLTPKGAQQLKTLGEDMRRRYNTFLPLEYKREQVLIRSTRTPRTLDSAVALASGLYPNQTIDIYSQAMGCDYIFYPQVNCSAYQAEKRRIFESKEVTEIEKNHASLFKWISSKVGKEITHLHDIQILYTNLLIEEQRGMKHPNWVAAVYPEPLRTLTGFELAGEAMTELSRRLRFGTTIVDVLEHASKAGGNNSRILYVYSAHDTNVVGLLKLLGCYNNLPPGFAAMLLFEVYKDTVTQEREIKFFYRNESKFDLEKLYVPECGYSCSVTRLQLVLGPYLPKDLHQECKITNIPTQDVNEGSMNYVVVIAYILAFSIVLGMVLCSFRYLCTRRREYTELKGHNVECNGKCKLFLVQRMA